MARMIDAERLAEGLKLHHQPTDQKHETDRQWAVGYNAGLERALHSITYAPTIDPETLPIVQKLRAELERMRKIMRDNGIMVIPSKYPGGRSEWNIPKLRG